MLGWNLLDEKTIVMFKISTLKFVKLQSFEQI